MELERRKIGNYRYLSNCIFEDAVTLSSAVVAKNCEVFIGGGSYVNDSDYVRALVSG